MKYLVLYKGPATPSDASHEGWPEWFEKVGEHLVDVGSPMLNGLSLTASGEASATTCALNGYSIIEAADTQELQALLADHPYLGLGDGYSIEVFEIPKK